MSSAGQAGLCSLFVPTAHYGRGLPYSATAPAFEELGRVDALYGFALSMHNNVAMLMSTAPRDSVASRWSEPLCTGQALGSFLLTESQGGSDPIGSMNTKVSRDGNILVLNGTKAWASLAGEADVYVVICRAEDGEYGTQGMMMVLVQANDPGVIISRIYDKATGSFFPIGDIEFANVRLDASRILAPAGHGLQLALYTIDVARLNVAALSVGISATALDVVLAIAGQRHIFSSSVTALQANQFALADVETSIQAGRLLYQRAAELMHRAGGTIAAAHAKRFCADAAVHAALTCSQVMGANGSLNSYTMPRLLSMAQLLTMADGTSNIQRLLIGRELQKRIPTQTL